MSTLKAFNTPNGPPAFGPFSHAKMNDSLLFTTGQLGIDPATGNIVPGGVEAETRQVFRNLTAILEEAGHEVTYAANGEVALALYAKKPFPVVLVDLVMPVKNGLQTISELMEMDKSARIVAFSGVAPEDLDLSAHLGLS